MISLVVAAAENNAIGKNNQLLWHLPNDLKFFKNLTWGSVVIMGRKTFESVNKPLPGRTNIVITRQKNWKADGVMVACHLSDALEKAKAAGVKEVFVIGGGQIYNEALTLAHRIYLTRVHAHLEGDVFFPMLDTNFWELIEKKEWEADEKHAYDYAFERWERKY